MLKSLDPRITRLNIGEKPVEAFSKDTLDQLSTFEVFLQKKEGANYEHAGIVHAPDTGMAFLFAKEQFSRRFTCTGLWIARTEDAKVTEYTDLEDSIYDRVGEEGIPPSEILGKGKDEASKDAGISAAHVEASKNADGKQESYEIFLMKKRGKQHVYAGQVQAANYEDALLQSKMRFDDNKPVLNVWVIKTNDLLFSSEEDKALWDTLSEKKYRNVTSYKAKDKLNWFKSQKVNSQI